MMGRTCGKAGERNVTLGFGWVGRSGEGAELRVCTLRADKKTEKLEEGGRPSAELVIPLQIVWVGVAN